MIWPHRLLRTALLLGLGALCVAGCGTTRSSDTTRTATEQLLISDAIDRAVQSMNLQTLSGQSVYLDDSKLSDTVDRNYFISTLRQQLLASGCELREKREDADFVVEARAGAIGTDRNDLLFGLPSMNVPQIPLVQPVPAAIPEIPIAKRKDQRGIAKIAVFAYHRATGTPVWQSGIVKQESSANDVWIFGTGPFQRGSIYEGTEFAGKSIRNENSKNDGTPRRLPSVAVSQESTFTPPQQFAKKEPPAAESKVALAVHQEAVPPAKPVAPVAASAPASPPTTSTGQLANQTPTPTATPPATPQPPAPPLGVAAALATNTAEDHKNPGSSLPDGSAYVKVGDASPLPQPRFNSPQ